MNSKSRSNAAFLPLGAVILALLSAVCHGLLYLFASDATDVDGIYTTILLKSGTPTLLSILICTLPTVLLILLPFLLLKKSDLTKVGQEKEGAGLTFARIGAGITLLATTPVYFLLSPAATPYEKTAENQGIVLFSLLCAVAGALYFILPAITPFKKGALLFFLGVFALLFLSCELLLTHYFMLDFLSSPTRVFAVFGYGSLALFLLFDIKALVPERSSAKCKAAFGLAAFFLNVTDALPRLILSFMGKGGFEVTLTSFHTLFRLLLACYALLAVLPLFLQKKETAAEESEEEQTLPAPTEQEGAEEPVFPMADEETAESLPQEQPAERSEECLEECQESEPSNEQNTSVSPEEDDSEE